MKSRILRAAVAALLAVSVPPPSLQAAGDRAQATFRKLVAGRALSSEDPAVIDAVRTLDEKGFLPELLWVARNLDLGEAGESEPLSWWAVKRMKSRLQGTAKSWIKRQKHNGQRFDEMEVLDLAWQAGKRYAVLKLEVTLKEGVISYTAFYKYRLTLKIDVHTQDVVTHRWTNAPR